MRKVLRQCELEQFSQFCQVWPEKQRVLIALKLHIPRLAIELKILCHRQDHLLPQIVRVFLRRSCTRQPKSCSWS